MAHIRVTITFKEDDGHFSLADAKEAVSEKLEELNGYAFKKREGNRRDAYIHEENEFMQPLPFNSYELSLWSDQTVLLDYTVSGGLNKYSVPYDLIGESVSVRAIEYIETIASDVLIPCGNSKYRVALIHQLTEECLKQEKSCCARRCQDQHSSPQPENFLLI